MFTAEDVRELLGAFPDANKSLSEQHGTGRPALVRSASGDGFIQTDKLVQKVREVLEAEKKARVSASALASSFDVDRNSLLEVLRGSTPDASEFTFSRDCTELISLEEASRLQKTLSDMVSRHAVRVLDFSQSHDVSPESLFRLSRLGASLSDPIDDSKRLFEIHRGQADWKDAYVYSPEARANATATTKSSLERAGQASEVVKLPKEGYLAPPSLRFIIDSLSALGGQLTEQDDEITFTPTSYLVRQRDERLKALVEGLVSSVSLQCLVGPLPQQFPDIMSAEKFVRRTYGEHVVVFFDTAFSRLSFEQLYQAKIKELREKGIINSSDPFNELSPNANLEATMNLHTRVLETARQDEEGTMAEGTFPYLIRVRLYMSILDDASDAMVQHAHKLYSNRNPTTDDLAIDIPSLLQPTASRFSLSQPLFHILLRCGLESTAKSAFASTITSLDVETDKTFATFWHDRLVSRVEVYVAGASSIPDEKLRSQLQDVLRDYITKELVPDVVGRAEAKNLVRSAKAKRQVGKLQALLQTQAKDLEAALSSLHKFGTKFAIPPMDAAALSARKDALVAELTRGVAKDKDAPRLFLACVVLLWARRSEALVYATGKFAPKLLKLLKGALDEGVYEKLEGFKDKVKQGTLNDTGRVELRKLVDAVEK
ncbi:uncharacterized protein IWZ02DRAFT_78993 [Phyllosticta citriasiana]|uniref:uncharacterized protein n=1 Tax=Phyllosticta citriasiana TaxID=595635 RepID=UPI0030FDE581